MLTFLSLFRCGTSTAPRESHFQHPKNYELRSALLEELHFLSENANKAEYAAWRSSAFNLDESFGWSDWATELLNDANASTVWNTLKISIQRGVPDVVRKTVWLKANDADSFKVQHPGFYSASMRNTFGTKTPDSLSGRCPTFSGGMLGLQEDIEGIEIDVDEWEVDLDILATPRLSYSNRALNISDSAEDLLKTWFSGTPKSSPSLSSEGYTPQPSVAALGINLPPEHNFWLPPAIIEPVDADGDESLRTQNVLEETGIFCDVPTKFNAPPPLVPMDTHEWHDFRTYMKSTHVHRMQQSQRMTFSRQQWREKLRDESFMSSEEDYGIPKFASDLYPSMMDSGQFPIRSSSASVGNIDEVYHYSSEAKFTRKKSDYSPDGHSTVSSNRKSPFFLSRKKEDTPGSSRETLHEHPPLAAISHSPDPILALASPIGQSLEKNPNNAVTSPIKSHPFTKKGSFMHRLKLSLQFGKKSSVTIPVKENPQVEVATDILSYGRGAIVVPPSSSENIPFVNGNIPAASSLDNLHVAPAITDTLQPELQESKGKGPKGIFSSLLLTDYIQASSKGFVNQNTPSTGGISDDVIERIGNTETSLKVSGRESKEAQAENNDFLNVNAPSNILSSQTIMQPVINVEQAETKEAPLSTFTLPVASMQKADIQLLENVTEFTALLTENGQSIVRSVLWCLNSLHTPEFEFCPVIPHLACLLALTMDAQEILCVLHSVVKRAIRSCSSDCKRPYLTYKRADFVRFVKLIMGGIRQHQTKVFNHLRSLKVDLAAWVARAIQDGYAKMLPFDYVLRIYGAFLYEGCKVFYRYCLAIFKFLKKDLLSCTSLREAEDLLYHISSNPMLREVDLTKLAYKIRIRSRAGALAALSIDSPSPYLLAVQLKHLYRPRLHDASDILSDSHWEIVWTWLPTIVRILDPVLVYQSLHDGMSILALEKKLENRSHIPTLFFIKADQEGEIFGGYFPFSFSLLKQAKEEERYCESFLFQLSPKEKVFRWTGKNRMCLKCTTEYIAVGGLDVAIYIDSHIHYGRTRASASYDSLQFVSNPPGDFVIKVMEIWQLL
ncbi:TLD protein [Cardiosporidium cionae]|uniref:TLD protein n=1 Tax=Cardiosporidium cionae TaxID=476202 RepID=A0ABQ7JDM2_9APIC|nr:TLD protein [Cardiosporidium cionae]|eukprot:KAF8821969.1 TLD protein [Cardiosporidium cionae]